MEGYFAVGVDSAVRYCNNKNTKLIDTALIAVNTINIGFKKRDNLKHSLDIGI